MKKTHYTVILSTAALCFAASSGWASSSAQHFEYANVVSANPIYETIQTRKPIESCWTETVRIERPQRRSNSATPTLVGGLIGGAIGNAVGSGKKNKKIGAVVGTILGMSIGNDTRSRSHRHNNHSARYEEQRRCETTYETQSYREIQGYDVSYRYKGQTYTTFMNDAPGKRIKLAVSFSPVHEY